ncbi:MAG TPA: glycerate kinase, partial [Anaerolineaceae bacterium]|nr:glycerate kinase [Anaerolineaceae bacterium]
LPVIAIVGSREISLNEASEAGIDTVIEIQTKAMPLKEAMENTATLAVLAGEKAMQAFLAGYYE